MKTIDIDNWKRKDHYNFFHSMDFPQYNTCANIDVTNFYNFVKKKKIPFYYAMIYAATIATNEVVNFRYRIRENCVVLHENLHPSFTYLDDNEEEEEELFKIVLAEMKDNIVEYAEYAEEKAKNQNIFFTLDEHGGRDDLLYMSCIPWISFTGISHTITLNRDDSVPRISWGKYFKENDKILLPFSVQVHHGLVDGVHVGKYFKKLQEYLDALI